MMHLLPGSFHVQRHLWAHFNHVHGERLKTLLFEVHKQIALDALHVAGRADEFFGFKSMSSTDQSPRNSSAVLRNFVLTNLRETGTCWTDTHPIYCCETQQKHVQYCTISSEKLLKPRTRNCSPNPNRRICCRASSKPPGLAPSRKYQMAIIQKMHNKTNLLNWTRSSQNIKHQEWSRNSPLASISYVPDMTDILFGDLWWFGN